MFPFLRRRPRPDFVSAYEAATPRRIPGKTPLADLAFAVLDCETTGFDPLRDRILSVAQIPIRAARIEIARGTSWLVFRPDATLNDAVRVHGILPSQSAAGEPEPAVLAEFLPTVAGTILVGHHVGFDLDMLDHALQRHHRVRLRNPSVDTALLAMRALEAFARTAYPGQHPPTLEEVCAQCGLPPVARHTAAGDAFTTAEIFLVLCARLQRRLGRPLRAADLPLHRR